MLSRAREPGRWRRATDPARWGQRLRLAVAVGVLWALACDAAGADTPAAGGINVVANRSVPADALSLATLRSVFLIRTSEWADGTRITVFVLPDRDENHVAFCTKLLKTFPYVLRDSWDRAVFTGTGKAPIEVPNEQELLRRVAATPGAIGYFQSARVTDEKIKLLQIR
jgi:ABC-type phosphate transport system substrate-binding protein